jgi:predicted oxidoreductase
VLIAVNDPAHHIPTLLKNKCQEKIERHQKEIKNTNKDLKEKKGGAIVGICKMFHYTNGCTHWIPCKLQNVV